MSKGKDTADSVVFGWHAVMAIVEQNPASIAQVWIQEGRSDQRRQQFLKLLQQADIGFTEVHRRDMDSRVAGNHQGVIAQIRAEAAQLDEHQLLELVAAKGKNALLLILDGVTDPHNLGACMRSADAVGVDAVVVPKDRSASLTPVVRKVACGAAESVPLVRVTNLARCLRELQEAGMWLIGADGEAEQSLYDVAVTGPIGLVMGAEGSGMRRLTREHCDQLIKLPMLGRVESLNVSVATGVCLYEVLRQRNSTRR